MSYPTRWQHLRARLEDADLAGALFFSPESCRYLTGFSGSNAQVWCNRDRVVLLTDGRYRTQAETEANYDDLVIYQRLTDAVAALVPQAGVRYGYEAAHVVVQQWARVAADLHGEWCDLGGVAEQLRACKDAVEIAAVRAAIAVAESAYTEVAQSITAGQSELEVALRLEWAIRSRGARKVPFEIIVASGARSALPHGIATTKKLMVAEGLTIDFGAESQGYFSDMTVSGSVAQRNPWHEDIVAVLCEAQAAALAAIAPGVPAADVDRAARSVIDSHGYGEYFMHSLGHGVGLAVHEAPRLSAQSDEVLQEGMIVTVEPGIYVAGCGGARVEDMVLVTPAGAEILTTLPKAAAVWPQPG